jgi:hypothetical protein
LEYEERLAISIACFGGLSYRETAIVLDLPEGTVKTRIRRGLHGVRALLGPTTSAAGSAVHLDSEHVAEDLERALRGRLALAHAAGLVAERAAIEVTEAVTALRARAVADQRDVAELAHDILVGELDAGSALR